jgi:hypothetical protein
MDGLTEEPEMNVLRGRIWGAAFILILAGAGVAPPRAAEDFRSAWRDREITLDGSAAEWEGSLERIEKSEVYVGILNDDEYLYVCIQSRDPQVSREALFRGLIVDLDPGKGGPFSIQYPIGMSGGSGAPPPGGERSGGPPRGGDSGEGGGAPPGRDPGRGGKMWEAARETLDTFLLLEPGRKERLRFAVDNGFGIGLRVSANGDGFVYEMKIPLNAGGQYSHAIGARPGGRLTLAIKTPGMDREGMEGRPEGGIRIGAGGGGGPGRGGVGPGGGGGDMGERGVGGPGRGPDSQKPLSLKVRFLLALPGMEDRASEIISP